jgi:hypothetical protein
MPLIFFLMRKTLFFLGLFLAMVGALGPTAHLDIVCSPVIGFKVSLSLSIYLSPFLPWKKIGPFCYWFGQGYRSMLIYL